MSESQRPASSPAPDAKLRLIATAPMGLEAVVARELKGLGYDQQTVENGREIGRAHV